MEQLEAKLEDTNRRLSQLSQQIAETQGDLMRLRDAATGTPGGAPMIAPAPGSAVAPGRLGPTGPSPAELYDTAFADYTKGRYALAIQGFQDYLSSYPSTDLSDNAQYWVGESHFAQKKFSEAIADFSELLKKWPASDKAAAALLKKGYALLELGQKAEAVVQLQYVIHEFPTSEEARLARARLKSIGVDAK
jgi:tol-pal system protein YbgF